MSTTIGGVVNEAEIKVGEQINNKHFNEREGEVESDDEEDGEGDDDDNDEFLEAEDDLPPTLVTTTTTTANEITLKLASPSILLNQSKPARLASESMKSSHEHNIRPSKSKNKRLDQLQFEDVKMSKEEMELDFKVVWKALHLFLNSRMKEAETICSISPHSLYYSLGYSFIQCLKSLATYEPIDLESAINSCKSSILIASLLRKKDFSLWEKFKGGVSGSLSVENIKNMSIVERHAELIWAEGTLLKVSFFSNSFFPSFY